jgi:RHS repeat-associated protein
VSFPGWTYVYDGDGKRVKKVNGSTGTLYWTGVASDALSESDLAGTIQKEYIFFNGKRIARRDVVPNTVHYYFSDHLGSASVMTNATGGIEDESDYYPYGGEIALTNTVPQNYKFTGRERDTESGLDDFGARFYSSALGRFSSPDPLVLSREISDPQTLNKYSYAFNRPTVLVDPDGEWPGWY